MYTATASFKTTKVHDESIPYFSCIQGEIFKNRLIINSPKIKKEIVINDIAFVSLIHSRKVMANYLAAAAAAFLFFLLFLLNVQDILIFPFIFLGAFSLFYKSFDYHIKIIFRVPSTLYVNVEKKELKTAKQLVKMFNQYRIEFPKYSEIL